jgi:malonyl-CoA/methylmalonyl-CoA synthetase
MLSPIDLAKSVEDAASSRPDHLFLRTPEGRKLTYGALRTDSGRIAAALVRRGVEPGDRITVQVEKSLEAVLLYVACLRMGAIYVPINVANTAHEVEHFFRDSRPKLAVVRPQDRHLVEPLAAEAGIHCIETLGADADGSLLQLAAQCEDTLPAWFPSGSDLAAIVYTSGTTGRSKGAMLTRANLASNASVLASAWRFTGEDVLLHALPLFHIHGLFAAINTVLASGSGMLLLPKFDAAAAPCRVESRVDRQHSTVRVRFGPVAGRDAPRVFRSHGTYHSRALRHDRNFDEYLEPLRGAASGRCRGQTAAGNLDSPQPCELRGRRHTVRCNRCARGQGPQCLRRLLARRGEDSQGIHRRRLVQNRRSRPQRRERRAKDLVISGGFNVYPKEVEAELDSLAGILESAVFGVPHPDFGEGVTAAVVAKPGATLSETTIMDSIKERLARYKVPKRIILMEELPRNTMGKVQKSALRNAFAAIYLAD